MATYMFQSTRPRGARLDLDGLINLKFNVSIHAPTRGATYRGFLIEQEINGVSIHAPTRGAT